MGSSSSTNEIIVRKATIVVDQINDAWIKTKDGTVFYFNDPNWNLPADLVELRKARTQMRNESLKELDNIYSEDTILIYWFVANNTILHIKK